MTQLQERDAISVATFQGIIKATYLHSSGADNANPALIEHYAREALQRMIDDGLVVLESDSSNSRITPANALFRVPNNLLANVASFPRILFLLIVAVLWILSPFDLLPDSLPLVGMLDDVSVTILSGFALKNAVES
ncbi:MAG: DUF1232 domain-containing protein [Victivallales bacterium]|nr:DUF1232 domain-containing protein [Victivallales bacterium]